MNILNILDQIDFDQTKPPMISVGVVIRKVITCIHKELVSSLEQLAKSTNVENKKNTIANTIKNMNRAIKKLSKFISNIRKFNKIYKIDLFTSLLYSYQDMLNEIPHQLYQNQHYCKFIRIPKFNLNETSRILNNTSHKILRNEIVNSATDHCLFENKEKMFNFYEKYFYLEAVNNNEVSSIINIEQVRNRMKNYVEKCYSNLNFGNIVFLVNKQIVENNSVSFSKKEYYDFFEKESYFYLFLGNLLRVKILFLFYTNLERKPILTYSIERIEILGNQKFKEKAEGLFYQKLFELNNILVELIKIDLDKKENISADLGLNDLRLLLKNYINKNFSKMIFNNLCNSFRDVIEKKINVLHKTEIDKAKKGIKISFEIPQKFVKLDFFISINLEEEFTKDKSNNINYKDTDKNLTENEKNNILNNLNINNARLFENNKISDISNFKNLNILNDESYTNQLPISSETIFNNLQQGKNLDNLTTNLHKMDIEENIDNALDNADKTLNIAGVADLVNNVTLNEIASANPNVESIPQNKTLLHFLNKELEVENYLIITFSHKIIQQTPFVTVKNNKLKHNLFELNTVNFKEIVLNKIQEYQEIVFEKVFAFLKKLKFNFFALRIMKIKNDFSAANKKLQIYFDKHLLFSLCITDNFDILIQDSQTFFGNKINENYIENSINLFLQEDLIGKFNMKDINFLKFQRFIFSKLIENYFKFYEINAIIDYNQSNLNQFAIKICFVDQKLNNSKCFLVLEFDKNLNQNKNQQQMNLINLLPNKANENLINSFYSIFKKDDLLKVSNHDLILPNEKNSFISCSTRNPTLYYLKELYILIEPMEFLLKSIFEEKENTITYEAQDTDLVGIANENSKENNILNSIKSEIPIQKESSLISNPLIKKHKILLKTGFLSESNGIEKSPIFNFYMKQIPITNFDAEFLSKIIELHFLIKSSQYEIFMSISEFIFYFQKFKITQELEIFEIKIEENLNSLKNLCRNANEFTLLKNLISEISFRNKTSGIELKLKPEIENFMGLSGMIECKTNSYVEGEYCQSFSPESRIISFNFITKNLHKASDTNFIKKIFDKFLPRLLIFFTRIKNLMENESFKQTLKESENIVLTPLEIKFTYNFFKQGKRTIKLTFLNRKNDFNLIKLFISNLPKNYGILFSIELINYHQRLINESALNIYDNIMNLVFFLIIIEKTFSKFPFHFNPLGKEVYEYITDKENNLNNTTINESLIESSSNAVNNYIQRVSNAAGLYNSNVSVRNKVYGIVKEQKKIHLICVERFNLVLEIQDTKNILIYSHTFDTNPESRDLINSFYDKVNTNNNQTIQLINIPGNNVASNLVTEIKNDLENKNKIIHLLNDKPEELLKVIDVVYDRIQNFGQ